MPPATGPTLVLAPTDKIAHLWAQDQRLPMAAWRIVRSLEDIRGRRGARMVVLQQHRLPRARHDALMVALRWGGLAEVVRA